MVDANDSSVYSNGYNDNTNGVKTQCCGITIKGQRCKINVVGKYCHYHKPRSSNDAKPPNHPKSPKQHKSPSKQPKPTSGFIYIYTLEKFFSKSDPNWFKVKNLPNCSKRNRDKWVLFKAYKSPYILMKIGMTTQTVNNRIKQWQEKCNHDLRIVTPLNDKFIKNDITELFKKLSLKKPSSQHYSTFVNEDNGFKCKDVAKAETEIHHELRKTYGKGNVFCSGCLNDKSKTNELFTSGYNIHIEWFLIPKTHVNSVYKIIDLICSKYY